MMKVWFFRVSQTASPR